MLYAFDGQQPVVGKDTYVSEIAHVIGDVIIGDNCYIGHGAIIRGDYGRIEIGNGTAVEEGAVLHAPPEDVSRIGENVTIGHGAVVHGQRIGDQAVIGMGTVISIWSEIGTWAIIAEGGVVKMRQAIPDMVVAAGNPVKVVREVKARDKEFWIRGKQVYVDLAKKYLDVGMHPMARVNSVDGFDGHDFR
jgi:carbonic anhydrase/acetyltransferase-like protein (isoleucine patch superfamily)